MAETIQDRVDKKSRWIQFITATIPAAIAALVTILLAIFGLPKQEEFDNLESIVETQDEKIDDLEMQIERLLNGSGER